MLRIPSNFHADKKRFFFFFGIWVCARGSPVVVLLLALVVIVALALVDAAAVEGSTVALTVCKTADATVANQSGVLLVLCAHALVGVATLLTGPAVLVAVAVLVAAVVARLWWWVQLVLALLADEPVLELVERERLLLAVVAGFGRLLKVLAEESLEVHKPAIELIAVGRQLDTRVAGKALLSHLQRVLPGVAATQVAVRFLKPCGRHRSRHCCFCCDDAECSLTSDHRTLL